MTNLLPTKKARKRGEERELQVLKFLNQEIYSNAANLRSLFNSTKGTTSTILSRMVNKGYLIRHEVNVEAKKIPIWGITTKGIVASNDPENAPNFEFCPQKIGIATLYHKLLNQRAYIELSRLGWTDWLNADRQEFKEKYNLPHRPDALITASNGVKVAIETEISPKTPIRYRSIIKSHVEARTKGYWNNVFYVVPDEPTRKIIEKRIQSVKYVDFGSSRYPIEKYTESMLSVFTVDDLRTIVIVNKKQ